MMLLITDSKFWTNLKKLLNFSILRLIYIGKVYCKKRPLAVSRHDYAIHTYLGHLGQNGINKNNPISGGLPKVAKVSTAGLFVG
jgi:hypothetical protein